jgi:hypothetical protein
MVSQTGHCFATSQQKDSTGAHAHGGVETGDAGRRRTRPPHACRFSMIGLTVTPVQLTLSRGTRTMRNIFNHSMEQRCVF